MAEPKVKLRQLRDHIYEDVDGGSEPLFVRSVERGEVQFWHQTGYGYLPESRVEVVTINDPAPSPTKGGGALDARQGGQE